MKQFYNSRERILAQKHQDQKREREREIRQRIVDSFFSSEKVRMADQMTSTSDIIYCVIHKTVFAGYSRAFRRISALNANPLWRD